jgi:NAD+ synthase (glutamine-hydrolysing)
MPGAPVLPGESRSPGESARSEDMPSQPLRLTLAQLNVTIGDVTGNVSRMIAAAEQASAEQSDVIVFSELVVTGYLPGDLLDEPWFRQRALDGVSALQQASVEHPDLYWVIGAPLPREGLGKALYNMLLVLHRGDVVLAYAKQLLPTYNVFNEHRYFESGPDVAPVLDIKGTRVGFMVCEDAWNDTDTPGGAAVEGASSEGATVDGGYRINPLEQLRAARPDLVISINASPSSVAKREERHQIFEAASARSGLPIVYVNQIGGHDQLVYDGASFVVEPERGVVFEAARFREDVVTLSLPVSEQHRSAFSRSGLPTPEFHRRQIVLGLRDYARRCGFSRVVVGSSGGIDSALTVALAAEAMGSENVTAITMPSRFSSSGSVNDSEALCENLGLTLHTHPIRDLFAGYAATFEETFGELPAGLTLQNLQSRIRGTVLMEYSNQYGHLLLTTGNKSELSVGYCTLYGDTNGGLNLIGDLYKTEVFELARHLNEVAGREIVPPAIIEKEPSAELAPDQKDTDSLPPYPVLDEILKVLIEGEHLEHDEEVAARRFVSALQTSEEGRTLIERVRRMIFVSEFKRRQSPPIIRVRSRAFGAGRQMPIAAHYDPTPFPDIDA